MKNVSFNKNKQALQKLISTKSSRVISAGSSSKSFENQQFGNLCYEI